METTQADGRAESEAAERMIARSVRKPGTTIDADKGYDVPPFVAFLKQRNLKAHVAAKTTGSLMPTPAASQDSAAWPGEAFTTI